MNVILHIKKEMFIPLKPIRKEDTLLTDNWKKVADQTSWYMEGNSRYIDFVWKVLSEI